MGLGLAWRGSAPTRRGGAQGPGHPLCLPPTRLLLTQASPRARACRPLLHHTCSHAPCACMRACPGAGVGGGVAAPGPRQAARARVAARQHAAAGRPAQGVGEEGGCCGSARGAEGASEEEGAPGCLSAQPLAAGRPGQGLGGRSVKAKCCGPQGLGTRYADSWDPWIGGGRGASSG